MKVSNSRERLLELLEMTHDTQADMVRKSGVEKSAISNYIKGKREPRQDKILAISLAYNVNPAWLMGLDVPMKAQTIEIDKTPDIDIEKAIELYSKYADAIPAIKAAVDSLLNPPTN